MLKEKRFVGEERSIGEGPTNRGPPEKVRRKRSDEDKKVRRKRFVGEEKAHQRRSDEEGQPKKRRAVEKENTEKI